MGQDALNTDSASLLKQCFQEAERRVPELIKRCIDAVISSLQVAEGASLHPQQRQLFARATLNLAQNRMVLALTYPRRLHENFAAPPAQADMTGLAGLSDSSMLQLVDDAAVNESLESVRLLQNLLPLVEHSLPILDARMSSLIGLDAVEVEKNPLRPSVFVRELRDLMAEIEPDGEIRVLWLQHIAHTLGRELGQLYEQLALMLQRSNVQEASYRIRLVEDPEANRAISADGRAKPDLLPMNGSGRNSGRAGEGGGWGGPNLPAMRSLGHSRSELGSSVFQAFLAENDAAFEQPLESDYYEQVRREQEEVSAWAALPAMDDGPSEQDRSAYRNLPAVERPSLSVSVETPLAAERWGDYGAAHERTRVLLGLKERAQHASQAIGLDLVRKLVNQVARDPLLLAPVREAVVALEPALLRLALAQPRYFSEADHPARRLVEEVAQRSFRFNDEFAQDFLAFMEPVCETFNGLNALVAEEPQPFAQALSALREGWAKGDAAEQTAHDRQLNALRHAESRQELADQIAWEISLRPDVFNAPELVLDFLYGAWSLVLAASQLRGAEADEQTESYRSVVGTLLWSVRPETLRQPKRVFESLPGLLKTMHDGLDMLGKSSEETQSFFDALMPLHQPLLRLRRARAQHDADSTQSASFDMEEANLEPVRRVVSGPIKPFVTAQPWMAAREWENAGFEDTQPAPRELHEANEAMLEAAPLMVDEHVEPDDVMPSAEMETQAAQALLASLRPGSRIDLFSGGVWIRADLVWASARGTLFMFSSPGGRSHSMTRRSCEKLILSRWFRTVEVRQVVDAAIRTLTEEAAPSRRRSSAASEAALQD